jgi:tRNA-intron endonuclease
MQTTGELKNNIIIVEKQRDIGRLYSKSHLGEILNKDKLKLNLLEGVFLLSEGKLKLYCDKKEVDFSKLVKIASNNISDFEIKFLVFKDLRSRGHPVKLFKNGFFTFYDYNKRFFVSVFSEKDILNLKDTKKLIKETEKEKRKLWFAIVDEEGDITYYDVSIVNIKGSTKKHKFKKSEGILLNDRIALFDKKNVKILFEKEFFGKPFGEGLQLSLIEVLYLQEKNLIEIKDTNGKKISKSNLKNIIKKQQPDFNLRLFVFNDLKNRGLIVKTGFKFGAHFRAYSKKPDKTHAEYLIHVVDNKFKSIWPEISRAVRLAHSVNKEIIIARVFGKKIDYIKFGRLRP